MVGRLLLKDGMNNGSGIAEAVDNLSVASLFLSFGAPDGELWLHGALQLMFIECPMEPKSRVHHGVALDMWSNGGRFDVFY
jgi:hypothetical protein